MLEQNVFLCFLWHSKYELLTVNDSVKLESITDEMVKKAIAKLQNKRASDRLGWRGNYNIISLKTSAYCLFPQNILSETFF